MTDWTLFYNPAPVPSSWIMWLVVPLCLSVAVVYKTLRAKHVRQVFREVLVLMVYVIFGLVVLGAVLWAIQRYWPS